MARGLWEERRQDLGYVLVPHGRLYTLSPAPPERPLGPLAGPDGFPEPQPGPQDEYGPRGKGGGSVRGFFLDRYVY
jgi:hypothetical protein